MLINRTTIKKIDASCHLVVILVLFLCFSSVFSPIVCACFLKPFNGEKNCFQCISGMSSENVDNSTSRSSGSAHRQSESTQGVETSRVDTVPAPRSGDQGKTKRAHGSPDVDDRQRDLQPPLGAQAQLGYDPRRSDGANTTRPVAFRAVVQHRVTAYVTWPAHLDCDVTFASGVAGYIFRYRAEGDDAGKTHQATDDGESRPSPYVVRNLAVNFVLLDDLLPGMQYRYQVRYVPERGDASAWSQEAELDTHPPQRDKP